MRRIRLTFAVVAALGAFALSAGTLAAPVLAASHTPSSAKKKALRKCNEKRSLNRRKACRKNVQRRFAHKPSKPVKPAAPVAVIDVLDDFYSPDVVNIKSGDSIKWLWHDINHDPHNVTMIIGPKGVDRSDFMTSLSPSSQFDFTRTFIVPGTYTFACSLHVHQTMTVVVS